MINLQHSPMHIIATKQKSIAGSYLNSMSLGIPPFASDVKLHNTILNMCVLVGT